VTACDTSVLSRSVSTMEDKGKVYGGNEYLFRRAAVADSDLLVLDDKVMSSRKRSRNSRSVNLVN